MQRALDRQTSVFAQHIADNDSNQFTVIISVDTTHSAASMRNCDRPITKQLEVLFLFTLTTQQEMAEQKTQLLLRDCMSAAQYIGR